MNLESLLSGLAIVRTFLRTSELWLEFKMSTFRRAKTLVAGPMMFDFFLFRNQSYTSPDF